MTICRKMSLMSQPPSHELDRQPIEHLGMRRRQALRAKIFLRGDDADAEQLGPQAIDRHAGRQRIVAIHRANGPAPVGSSGAPAGSG